MLHGIGSIIMNIYGAGEKTKFNANSMNGVNLGGNLANMINANAFIDNGGGTSAVSRNLVDYKAVRNVKPNTRIDYMLVSGRTMKIGGKFDWYADINSASDAALAFYLDGGTGDNCCNNKYMYYINHARPNAPLSEFDSREKLGSWLMGKGPFYNMPNAPFKAYPIPGFDEGRNFGSAPAGCKKPIVIQNKSGNTLANVAEEKASGRIVGAGNQLWLKGNTNAEHSVYRVLDATGRVIANGNATGSDVLLYNIPAERPPSYI